MKYIPGMDQYSLPTKDLDDVINDSTAPIISISVEMNVVQRMLNTPRPKSNKQVDEIAFDEDRKCTDSIIDIDSFWRFQNTSKQRLMISLPSDIYTFFDGLPNTTCNLCFEWLQKRLPNCDMIFDYSCIDITIHHWDHFSRVFVVNASKALDKIKKN